MWQTTTTGSSTHIWKAAGAGTSHSNRTRYATQKDNPAISPSTIFWLRAEYRPNELLRMTFIDGLRYRELLSAVAASLLVALGHYRVSIVTVESQTENGVRHLAGIFRLLD
jgi:hypothetical protein